MNVLDIPVIRDGEKITVPFLPEFRGPLLSGAKTMTSRTKLLGYVGDWFEIYGATFVIKDYHKWPLSRVVYEYFKEEGFPTPEQFLEVWKRIHPRAKLDLTKKVYVHEFIRCSDHYEFHIHDYAGGRCRVCGCLWPVVADTEQSGQEG